jgi:hypothetical protein
LPHLTAAKRQCGTKRSKDQKIYFSRAGSSPVRRVSVGFFTGKDGTVAFEHVQRKLLDFFDQDMLQLIDLSWVRSNGSAGSGRA